MMKLPKECISPSIAWKAKIGLILPPTAYNCLGEFNALIPKGVATLSTCIPLKKVTPEFLEKMEDYAEKAAVILQGGSPDLLVFGCTSGSLVKGPGSDEELVKRLESRVGIRTVVTSTAVVEAMQALGMKNVVIVTPYIDELDELEKKFIEAYGIKVSNIRGLGISETSEIVSVNPLIWYRFIKESITPECDGVFISCTGINTLDIIDAIEADINIPVITSNQATVWAALKRLGIKKTLPGYGKLWSY